MKWNVVDVVMVLAASQGVFLAILIFHKHRKIFANRFLGLLMLCFSIILYNLSLSDLGYQARFPRLTLFLIGVPFIAIPLHFLYARYLIHVSDRFTARELLHFMPFGLYVLSIVPLLLKSQEAVRMLFRDQDIRQLPVVFILFNWTVTAMGLVYMLLTVSMLARYVRRIKNEFSTIDKIKLDWLRNMTVMIAFAWASFFLENMLLLFKINLSNFTFSSFMVSVFVYAMGYLGLLKTEVFTIPEIADSIRRIPAADEADPGRIPGPDPKTGIKYEKSGLSPEKAKEILEALLRFMETDKPYADCDLTLAQLAKRLSVTPHNLSEVINTRTGHNFYDFINQYRVEQVKKDLADHSKRDFKLLAIGLDAGFNSKTTFNTIFKRHTRLTPSGYREKLLR